MSKITVKKLLEKLRTCDGKLDVGVDLRFRKNGDLWFAQGWIEDLLVMSSNRLDGGMMKITGTGHRTGCIVLMGSLIGSGEQDDPYYDSNYLDPLKVSKVIEILEDCNPDAFIAVNLEKDIYGWIEGWDDSQQFILLGKRTKYLVLKKE